MKNALAAAATLALALAGCSDTGSTTTDRSNQTSPVSSLQMNLTLPDGTVINTVNYTVSGGPTSLTRSGVVNVEHSTSLRFGVSNLPAGPGYTMTLGATTTTGTACAGSAGFDIAANQVTTLTMTLVCGTGTVVEVNTNGDVSATVEVVNEAGVTCPVVSGISALPLEVLVGYSLQLEGYATSTTDTTFAWAGPGGTFAAPAAAATGYLCESAGDHALTFAIAKTGCDASSMSVTVTCTGTGGEPDAGEPEPDAGEPEPDAGEPEPDAGDPEPDAAVDAGPTTLFRSEACETCIKTACTDYSGVDLAGPCFAGTGFDPAFAQACSDVFLCSHNSADNCAYNTERGPVGCFCGETVAVDACQQGTVLGNCIPEWYAATQCPAGDHNCVLNNFINLTLPSGYANFMMECQNASCAAACAP